MQKGEEANRGEDGATPPSQELVQFVDEIGAEEELLRQHYRDEPEETREEADKLGIADIAAASADAEVEGAQPQPQEGGHPYCEKECDEELYDHGSAPRLHRSPRTAPPQPDERYHDECQAVECLGPEAGEKGRLQKVWQEVRHDHQNRDECDPRDDSQKSQHGIMPPGTPPIMTWMKVEDSGPAQLNPQYVQEPIVAEPSCLCSCSDRDGNCKNAQPRLPAEAGQPTCTPPLQTGTSDESCTLTEG